MMVYQWSLPGLFDVDAETAGNEMERIYKRDGKIEAAVLVDESRPANAPLHSVFEWDDAVAAEKWRLEQAGQVIRSIRLLDEREDKEPVMVRAFIHAQEAYHPIQVAVNTPDMKAEMMRDAARDMECFRRKYATLRELAPVLKAMEKAMEGLK